MPSFKLRFGLCARNVGLYVASVVLTLAVVFTNASMGQAYLPPGPVEEGIPANLALIYSGAYATARRESPVPTDVVRDDGGDWLQHDFYPYVTHLNWDGEPDDMFFDSFLFLGLSSHRGRNFAGERDQREASLWADWAWYIDRLFAPDKQLAALDGAVGWAKEMLGQPDYAANVYIMIPYPSYLVETFGFPGAEGDDSLLPVGNRMRAVVAYVDDVLDRWHGWQPEHIKLAGFYWLQEHINPQVPGEENFVRDVVAYVQRRGYKIGWIPWSGAYLATRWEAYGFDWAIIQPNHMFQDQPNLLPTAANRGRNARMGIEIEFDGRVREPAGEKRFYDYLDAGVEYGYMTDAMLGYYMDLMMLERLYYDDAGRMRHMYDDLYAFAKGTYPWPTAAGRTVSGTVRDTAGDPVAGATVQAGSITAVTDADGAFTVEGLYSNKISLLIFKPGYAAQNAVVATLPAGEVSDDVYVLAEAEDVTLHGLNTWDGLGGMGIKQQVVDTDRGPALKVIPSSPILAALRLSLGGDAQNWSEAVAVAFDAKNAGEAVAKIQLTVRDAKGQAHIRSVTLAPGVWQTVTVSVADLLSGYGHEPLTPDSSGIVDVEAVTLFNIGLSGVSNDGIVLHNVRLLGRGGAS